MPTNLPCRRRPPTMRADLGGSFMRRSRPTLNVVPFSKDRRHVPWSSAFPGTRVVARITAFRRHITDGRLGSVAIGHDPPPAGPPSHTGQGPHVQGLHLGRRLPPGASSPGRTPLDTRRHDHSLIFMGGTSKPWDGGPTCTRVMRRGPDRRIRHILSHIPRRWSNISPEILTSTHQPSWQACRSPRTSAGVALRKRGKRPGRMADEVRRRGLESRSPLPLCSRPKVFLRRSAEGAPLRRDPPGPPRVLPDRRYRGRRCSPGRRP